jgi:ADP-heptose:LPS heptosyltransferase
MKILAIQFRYLGDVALMTPALRAIREHFTSSALHVLVAEEVMPLLQYMPGLTRVWAFPRRRGRAKPTLSWPVIRALRQERFDRSIDFGGNDRGAIVSLFCGARERLGPLWPGGFVGRRNWPARAAASRRPRCRPKPGAATGRMDTSWCPQIVCHGRREGALAESRCNSPSRG